MKVWVVIYWGEIDKVFDSHETAKLYVTITDNPNLRKEILECEVESKLP